MACISPFQLSISSILENLPDFRLIRFQNHPVQLIFLFRISKGLFFGFCFLSIFRKHLLWQSSKSVNLSNQRKIRFWFSGQLFLPAPLLNQSFLMSIWIIRIEYMDNQNLKPARHLWLSSSRWIWFSKTNQKFKLENLYVNDFRPQHLFIVSDVVKHLSDRYLYLKLSCQIVDESGFWSIPTENSFKFRKLIWISDKSANFNENFLKK